MTELILGIETSCDETAAAVVGEDLRILSNVVSSQMELHARYGGVVPEVASRVHTSEIVPVLSSAMSEAGVTPGRLAAVAVTRGPGLIGSLLVGVSVAKALALSWGKPVLGINHLEGHLASASMGETPVRYPCLVLLVSGGHTLLARVLEPGSYELLGSTRDDSVGEAYDKVSRLLGFGYPGGPVLDRVAKEAPATLDFPRPMLGDGLEFSFSGLKSAVASYVRSEPDHDPREVAASFVAAAMDVLLAKLDAAVRLGGFRSIAVVGGVAASPILRDRLAELGRRHDLPVCLPPVKLATDNGAMIAAAAWPRFRSGGGDPLDFGADASLSLAGDPERRSA
ncbi:MAG: tRNA (adenosine(37)-N6)-threonylcarbamoyltransferase complex transferase subunit TsaD [Acidobacteriota bacterium]|jgi:N6-L-threonylcarbamoyladenine synthase